MEEFRYLAPTPDQLFQREPASPAQVREAQGNPFFRNCLRAIHQRIYSASFVEVTPQFSSERKQGLVEGLKRALEEFQSEEETTFRKYAEREEPSDTEEE